MIHYILCHKTVYCTIGLLLYGLYDGVHPKHEQDEGVEKLVNMGVGLLLWPALVIAGVGNVLGGILRSWK